MRDRRPPQSPMPTQLVPILDRYGPELWQLMSAVFDAALAAKEPREHAELVNDALSLQSELAAYAAVAFVAQLAEAKGLKIEDVAGFGMTDVLARFASLVDGLKAAADARQAVKQ